MDSRFQFQPLHTKAFRWIRWMPLAYFVGICRMIPQMFRLFAILDGVQKDCDENEDNFHLPRGSIDRKPYFWSIIWMPYSATIVRAQHSMGWWYTLEETFGQVLK